MSTLKQLGPDLRTGLLRAQERTEAVASAFAFVGDQGALQRRSERRFAFEGVRRVVSIAMVMVGVAVVVVQPFGAFHGVSGLIQVVGLMASVVVAGLTYPLHPSQIDAGE